MKDKFLKVNDLFAVLWNGRFWFVGFFLLALVFSFTWSILSTSSKYKINTILEVKNIRNESLYDIKIRFDNNYYVSDVANHFNISIEDIPDFKINVVKYYMHPEIYIYCSEKDVEQNKKYLEFIQKKLMKDLVELYTIKLVAPPYAELIENKKANIVENLEQIKELNKLITVSNEYEKEFALFVNDSTKLSDFKGETIKDRLDVLGVECKTYVLEFIKKQSIFTVELVRRNIAVYKKAIVTLELRNKQFNNEIENYEKALAKLGGASTVDASIFVQAFVSQDITVIKKEPEFLRNFILFFFAMMFLAMGVVFLKENS